MAGIREAFILFWRSLRILWDDLGVFAPLNAIWLLLCLPIVTAPASFAALYYVADKASRDEMVTIGDFLVGFKEYLGKGSLLGLLNVIAAVLIALNILFYSQVQAAWGMYVRIAWIAVALFWMLMQIYLLPMFVVQVTPSIKLSIRNAAMFVLVQPLFTFAAGAIIVALAALSIVLIVPLMVISMSVIALFSCVVMNNRLKLLQAKQEALAASEASESESEPATPEEE